MKPYFLFLVFFIALNAEASNVFYVLRNSASGDRIRIADSIYNKNIRTADTAFAFRALRELIHLSDSLDDHSLECFSWSLLADHIARKKGYNPVSVAMHLKAIELSKKYQLDLQTGMASYKLGRFYYNFKRYLQAFEYLILADGILKQIGYGNVPQADTYLYYMATIYYNIEDFDKAVYFLKQVTIQKPKDHWLKMQTFNTLAIIQQAKGDYQSAFYNFNNSYQEALHRRDSVWIGIVAGNLGSLMFQKKEYQKAKKFLASGFVNDVKYKEFGNALFAKCYEVKTDLALNNLSAAYKDILEAQPIIEIDTSIKHRQLWFGVLAENAEKNHREGEALSYWQKYRQMSDSVARRKDFSNYYNVQLRIETERHLAEMAALASNIRAEKIKRNSIILIVFLLMVLSLLAYNRQRLKIRSEKKIFEQKEALLESEKQMAEEALINSQQLLNNYTENIRQKNELIEQFTDEVEKLKSSLPANTWDKSKIEDFDKLVKSIILTDEDWDAFRKLFEKVHTGFFFKLKEVFPNLSVHDTRLISLIKLQLSNREMANMLGVSLDAVKKAKQRLYKKDFLPDGAKSLEDFVLSIKG